MQLPVSERVLQTLERLLLAISLVTLGWYGCQFAQTRFYQSQQSRALDARLHQQVQPDPNPSATLSVGSLVGRIEIPRLGLSAIIREGDDDRTLRLAVGHIPGTAIPGTAGNAALAGHRDTFFRNLRRVKPDDEIRITVPTGIHRYRVEKIRVVQPTDVWVLDPTRDHVLTLVSCYPFSFIGSAPERFIVQAKQVADKPAT